VLRLAFERSAPFAREGACHTRNRRPCRRERAATLRAREGRLSGSPRGSAAPPR
jgi:hypothetical protein